MRTSILIGKVRGKNEWKLMGSPADVLMDVKRKFRTLAGDKVSDEFERVIYQENDGHALVAHLRSKKEHAEFVKNREAETQVAVKAGKAEAENREKAAKEMDEQRSKDHIAEIERLNELPKPNLNGKSAPPAQQAEKTNQSPVDENGLRLDGPTPEEFVAAGYDMKNYPPPGFAAKAKAA